MPAQTDTKKLEQIRQYVESADLSLQEARALLEEMTGGVASDDALVRARQAGAILASQDGSSVIEGVFDGQNMVGPDGKQYSVPANYASKSKLVEGDLLKLTITATGSFIYKQIGPVERKRLRGSLVHDEGTEDWRVLAEGKSYKVLLASITYFKGNAGDDAVVLLPRDKSSTWAAVENIIQAGAEMPEAPEGPVAAHSEAEKKEVERAPEVPAASRKEEKKVKKESVPEEEASAQPVQFDDDKDEFEEI